MKEEKKEGKEIEREKEKIKKTINNNDDDDDDNRERPTTSFVTCRLLKKKKLTERPMNYKLNNSKLDSKSSRRSTS